MGKLGHYRQEPMSRSMELYYILVRAFFIDQFIVRSNFPEIRLPLECHDQSRETKSCICDMYTLSSRQTSYFGFLDRCKKFFG